MKYFDSLLTALLISTLPVVAQDINITDNLPNTERVLSIEQKAVPYYSVLYHNDLTEDIDINFPWETTVSTGVDRSGEAEHYLEKHNGASGQIVWKNIYNFRGTMKGADIRVLESIICCVLSDIRQLDIYQDPANYMNYEQLSNGHEFQIISGWVLPPPPPRIQQPEIIEIPDEEEIEEEIEIEFDIEITEESVIEDIVFDDSDLEINLDNSGISFKDSGNESFYLGIDPLGDSTENPSKVLNLENVYRAIPVMIENYTENLIRVETIFGVLNINIEAKTPEGEWKLIESPNWLFSPFRYDRMEKKYYYLEPGEQIMTKVLRYTGSFETELRVKWQNGEEVTYSEPFSSSINPDLLEEYDDY